MNDQQRAAMQMALHALVNPEYTSLKQSEAAIAALREALTQPQETTDYFCGMCGSKPCSCLDMPMPTTQAVPPVVQQGEWVDLTDDEIEAVICKEDSKFTMRDATEGEIARAVIAKFKSKNTPPVVPQGEPVGEVYREAPGLVNWLTYKIPKDHTKLYTTPPSVEAAIEAALLKQQELWIQATEDGIEAAIEATKEKAAKVCEEWFTPNIAAEIAAAIRSMK
jgi:hypothetical protein